MRFPIAAAMLVGTVMIAASAAAQNPTWKAGVARAVITPDTPMWMAGYASRDRPAEGKLNDLWAKALVLEDAAGKRVALVTLDVCGIDGRFSNRVRDRLRELYGLGRESVALSSSHTHSGPMVGDNLRATNLLDATQQGYVNDYTKRLEDTVVAVTGDAIKALAPARLAWTNGQATFAVNRRENPEPQVPELRERGQLKGPVDHDLPVLTVTSAPPAAPAPAAPAPTPPADAKLLAIVFGYACHATTTSLYEWSGDWPGVASAEIEAAHPGAVALSWIGCGADQNPLPRRSYALLKDYARQAARGVDAALASGKLKPIDDAAKLAATYAEIDLPFAPLPTKEQFEADLQSKDKFVANRAKILLAQLAKEGRLPTHYPYPVQVWRLGPELKWVLLGGEVVVDYSLRLKKELGPTDTWVGAYMNDVMAYIPSSRVLAEGKYEGETSMIYYCQPTKWAPEVEELIVKEAHRQVAATAKQ